MRRSLVCLMLALLPTMGFAAEPLTLLLLHIIRQQLESAVENAIEQARRERERPLVVVPPDLHELALKASAVRQAHERLAALSQPEKKALAAQARGEYEKLPVEERQQMIEVLRTGVVPLPRDLNDMILAEFSSVPAVPAAAQPATTTR